MESHNVGNQWYKPVGFYGPIAPPVPSAAIRNAPRTSIAARRRFNYNIPASGVLLQQCHCRNRHRGKLNVSPPSVLFEWSRNFLYNTQETQTQKIVDQNFEIRILWFLRIFRNFQKGVARSLAAKLNQSRVLVTKFRQNRLTLKGRSAGQRPTDRQTDSQTNSAENNGPSGLQSGQ